MSEMDDWVAAAGAELGLSPAEIRVDTVLDLARDVAHQVLRPAAPVTAYLMGVAVGRGADPAEVAGRLTALAASWEPPGARPPVEAQRTDARPPAGAGPSDARGSRSEHIDPPIG